MFTQVVVFATPPLALVKASFLNHAPHGRPIRLGPRPALRDRANSLSGLSTRHREGPFLSGRTVGSTPTIPGLGFGFYLHPVSAGGQRAADVVAQAAADPIVMEPDLLGPVKVQSDVPFGEVGPFVPHRRPYGGTVTGNSTRGVHAGYREASRAIACGLTGAGAFRPCDPDDPDRGPTRTSAILPPSSGHAIPSS